MTEQPNGNGPERPAIRDWGADYANLVKRTVLRPKHREATDVELAFFAEVVKRTGLDPIARQIYGVFRRDSRQGGAEVMTIQAAIDGFRVIAERSRRYEGQTPTQWCGPDGQWTDVWLKPDPPAAAKVGVLKQGFRGPLYAVATWREYVQTTGGGQVTAMWAQMPSLMLAKCAEALALRKAFPNDLSGVYAEEEMAQADAAERPAPSGGVVALPAAPAPVVAEASAVEEHEKAAAGGGGRRRAASAAVTADAPKPTEPAATAAQRRTINAAASGAGLSGEALRELLERVGGSPLLERLPKAKVDDVLHAVADHEAAREAQAASS